MSDVKATPSSPAATGSRATQRFLDVVEWVGNKLPDPAFLFVFALFITWGVSAWLAPVEFEEVDPRTREPVRVLNQLSAASQVSFLTNMVKTFIEFPPLGLVLPRSDRWQFESLTARPVEQRVGLFVVGELLPDRVPAKCTAQSARDIGEVANRD